MVPTATLASRAIISIVAFSTPRRAKTRAAAVVIRAARASFSARRRSRRSSEAFLRAPFRELKFMNMNSRYTAKPPNCQTRVRYDSHWKQLRLTSRRRRRCANGVLGNAPRLKHLAWLRHHAGKLHLPNRLTDSTVEPDRPAALLRVFDLDRHAPDAHNFDRPGLAVLHRAAALEARRETERTDLLNQENLR